MHKEVRDAAAGATDNPRKNSPLKIEMAAAAAENPYHISQELEDAYFAYPNEQRRYLLDAVLTHPKLPRFIKEHGPDDSYAVRFLYGTFTVHNTVEEWTTLRERMAYMEQIGWDRPELSEEDVRGLVKVIKDVLLSSKRAKKRAKNLTSLLRTSRQHSASLYPRSQGHGATFRGKYIPGDALSVISSYLTGEEGLVSTQLMKLREKSSRHPGAHGAHGGTRRGRRRRGRGISRKRY